MKHVSVPVEVFGEKYTVSGEAATVSRVVAVFRETLDSVARGRPAREVSSHRLAVLTALAIAEELVRVRGRAARKDALLADARRELACLVEEARGNGA